MHLVKKGCLRLWDKRIPHFHFCSRSKKHGVLIAVRDTVTLNVEQLFANPLGRYVILVSQINNMSFTLENVYVPKVGQVRFLLAHPRGPKGLFNRTEFQYIPKSLHGNNVQI